VQDLQKSPGYLLLVPIFDAQRPLTTLQDRRAALKAFVYAPIRSQHILSKLEQSGAKLLQPTVWDGDPQTGGVKIYSADDKSTQTSTHFSHTEKIHLLGRDLYVELNSTPQMEAAFSSREPLLTAFGGGILSALASFLVLTLGRSHSRAILVAQEMTKDIRAANALAEQALREAEVYRTTLDQYAIVSMTDSKGRIISANDAFCSISGYSREELLGKDHRVVNSGSHSKEFWRAMWNMVNSGKPWRQVVCNRAKNGSLYWVDSMITPFADAQGNIDRLVSIRFDVTAQKHLEQELLAASERLTMAMEAGGVGIWEYEPLTQKLEWGEHMFTLYGITRAQFPGAYQAWESAIHPDDKTRSVNELNDAIAGKADFNTQFRVLWPDGSIHHIRARAVVKRDAAGRPVRMIGTNWDITKDKENDEQRRLLTSILEQTPDFIGVSDVQGNLLYHNPAARAMIGLTDQVDLSARKFEDLHPPWAAQIINKYGLPTALLNGLWTGETALKHQDGSEIPVSQVILLHRDAHGQPIRSSTIMRDLRGQKAAEARLQALTSLQKGILDSANMSIVASDPDGVITHWNATATRMLQWTAEEMVGKQTPVVIHLVEEVVQRAEQLTKQLGTPIPPGFEVFVAHARNTGLADEREWTYVRKDGSRFPVLLSVTALWDNKGTLIGYLGIAADITDRKRHELELKQAMEAATAGARVKADFLAVMSHEIRTPMNGVIGMTNLLAKTVLDTEQREYVETVRTCGESLLTLINDILDFSKLEAGRVELEAIPFSPGQIIEEVIQLFSAQAEQKGLELAYQIGAKMPRKVIGDPTRLRQIMLNLVSNALKFTRTGSVTVSATLLRSEEKKAHIRLSVRDTGVGMTAEQVARLGEAFTQADSSTTRQFGGTGLGMTISKSLINLMGGNLVVESQPGVGTTFHVHLQMLTSNENITTDAALSGKRVLCVDDDQMSLRLMEEHCRGWGMQVQCFSTAQDLMRNLRSSEQLPDVILSDHEMTGIDGVMLARLIQSDKRFAAVPIVIASSDPDRARHELRNFNNGAVLDKPLHAATLMNAIVSQMQSHAPAASPAEPPVVRLQRILVVDDNRINQRVICALLKIYGVVIDTAENGVKAVQAVEQHQYDCVFMDCQMPEMDGYQATRAIRERERQLNSARVPIIALTAHALEGARDHCLAAGMDDYLSKPVRESDLSGLMTRLFASEKTAPHRDNSAVRKAVVPPTPPASDPISKQPKPPIDHVANLLAKFTSEELSDIAQAVLNEYPKMIKEMERANLKDDSSGLVRVAHNFKGSSAGMDLNLLNNLSRDLEEHAKSGTKEWREALIDRLKHEANSTVELFLDFLERTKK
jgi:two-component system, sensor histidine kinase and response regulator